MVNVKGARQNPAPRNHRSSWPSCWLSLGNFLRLETASVPKVTGRSSMKASSRTRNKQWCLNHSSVMFIGCFFFLLVFLWCIHGLCPFSTFPHVEITSWHLPIWLSQHLHFQPPGVSRGAFPGGPFQGHGERLATQGAPWEVQNFRPRQFVDYFLWHLKVVGPERCIFSLKAPHFGSGAVKGRQNRSNTTGKKRHYPTLQRTCLLRGWALRLSKFE